ncbi:hypothetical protein [Flagellimonas lutaonensis]|nr:hypothetical protein [Allomuricauda lutaonensis]
MLKLKPFAPDNYIYAEIIRDWSYYDKYSLGVMGYSIINWIPISLSFGKPIIFVLFNIHFYNLSFLFIFRSFRYLAQSKGLEIEKREYQVLLCLILFYPVGLIHAASLLREPSLLLFFSISLIYVVKLNISKINTVDTLLLALFAFCTLIIRPISGFTLLCLAFLAYGMRKGLFTVFNFLKFAVAGAIFVLLFQELVLIIYNLEFNIDWLSKFREDHVLEYGVEGYDVKSWDGLLFSIKNILLLFFQYLLSPLPILVENHITFSKFIPFLDSIYVFLLTLPMILTKHKKTLLFWLLAVIIVVLMASLFETNISGAFRHRMNGVLMLIPMAAFFISKSKILRNA